MKQCAACGQSAETKAALCPHCGAQYASSHTMPLLTGAKWLDFILGLPLGLVLLGIGWKLFTLIPESLIKNSPLNINWQVGMTCLLELLVPLLPVIITTLLLWRRYRPIVWGMLTVAILDAILVLSIAAIFGTGLYVLEHLNS